eukprot:1254831-Alexandrium_andersonii.AAC.1
MTDAERALADNGDGGMAAQEGKDDHRDNDVLAEDRATVRGRQHDQLQEVLEEDRVTRNHPRKEMSSKG